MNKKTNSLVQNPASIRSYQNTAQASMKEKDFK
jgi:hypothetical protein